MDSNIKEKINHALIGFTEKNILKILTRLSVIVMLLSGGMALSINFSIWGIVVPIIFIYLLLEHEKIEKRETLLQKTAWIAGWIIKILLVGMLFLMIITLLLAIFGFFPNN